MKNGTTVLSKVTMELLPNNQNKLPPPVLLPACIAMALIYGSLGLVVLPLDGDMICTRLY